jgi:serine/threonine protein kinase
MHKTDILGEGSFGCVVRPPVLCDSDKKKISKTKSDVGKLFVSAKDFKKEVATAKIVASIDPNGDKLLTPSEHCETSLKSITDPSVTWNCEALRELGGVVGDKRIYQLMMPYGGERLDDYLKAHKPSHKEFIQLMIPVMEAIVQLKKHKYCHQDIKVSNILVTPSQKAIVIDYSLMVAFKDIYKKPNRHYLRHTYLPYPPEYKSVYYKGVDKPKIMDEIMANVTKYLQRFRKAWAKEKNWIHNSANIAKYVDRIDVYSLGAVFIRVEEEGWLNNRGTSSAFKDAFADLIDDMVAINPEKRINPKELLARAKNLLDM